jgi:hypothetical protein
VVAYSAFASNVKSDFRVLKITMHTSRVGQCVRAKLALVLSRKEDVEPTVSVVVEVLSFFQYD